MSLSDQSSSKEPSGDAKLIADARAFFESRKGREDTLKTFSINEKRDGRQTLPKSLNWVGAFTAEISIGKVVKVPISFEEGMTLSYKGNKWDLSAITTAFIFKNMNRPEIS